MAGITLVLFVLLIVTGRLKGRSQQLAAVGRTGLIPLALAGTTILLLLLAARRYEEVRGYLVQMVTGTALFATLLAWFFSWPDRVERAVRRLSDIPPFPVAMLFGIVAAVAGQLVLGDIPHVSDEVAYQFQARSIALGSLAMPAPPVPEAFNFLHLMIHNGQWYGIMNPGWPALLALGEVARMPWIINPIVGGLALLVFGGFFREAGLDQREGRLAIVLMAISPLLIFMSGSYMSHPANLLLFGVFCWAWVRMLNQGSVAAALVAGLALAFNLLVRPVDTVFVTIPFLVQLLIHLRRRPRLLLHAAVVGVVGSLGIGATLVYNKQLTGNALEMPMTRYFNERNPQEQFGLGFGPQMGTKLHGEEWPGFTPVDALKVTAYRVVEFLKDLYGLPLILLAAVFAGLRGNWREWGEWRLVLLASGGAVMGVYFFHFYHGIAYGSRHYYLAVPAVAMVVGRLVSRAMGGDLPEGRRAASAAVLALLVILVTYIAPLMVREYAGGYRGVSPAVAQAVRRAGITRAVIFVEPGSWSWKSAFPLNRYPLEQANLVFARDRGEANAEVVAQFPSRPVYFLAVGSGNRVSLRPAAQRGLQN
jgi:hypothetical protein